MSQIVLNDYVDATLAAIFAAIVVAMVIYGVIESRKALANSEEHSGRDRHGGCGDRRRR